MLSNSILKAAVKSLMSCALKMGAPSLFEMSVTVQQSTRRHIAEDWVLYHRPFDNLKVWRQCGYLLMERAQAVLTSLVFVNWTVSQIISSLSLINTTLFLFIFSTFVSVLKCLLNVRKQPLFWMDRACFMISFGTISFISMWITVCLEGSN